MVKNQRLRTLFTPLMILVAGVVLCLTLGGTSSVKVNAQAPVAYDISQWQGNVSNNQAAQLKHEVNFMILKAENGGLYTDPMFNNNSQALQNNRIPYGAYDYSLYANSAQARAEADELRDRAPEATFYVNDAEENKAGNGFNAATQAWANEMHRVTSRPVVLYSDLYFMNNNTSQTTRNAYDALWLADYGAEPNPNYHYDLWQYTSKHYSPALGQRVDASTFPLNAKPLSFWTRGQSTERKSVPSVTRRYRKRIVVRKPRHLHRSYVNQNYYRSRRIDYLRVTNRGGIELYTMNGRRIGHVKRGTVLTVYGFKPFYYRSTGYMTRAIGIHYGRYDLFTANKHFTRPYWY